MDATRLRALKQTPRPLRVARDEGAGVIYGAALATEGEALGHDFALDAKSIGQIAEHFGDTPGRWTHGGLSDDGLGKHLGRWKNLSTREIKIPNAEGELELRLQAVGDFHFSESAHNLKPDGLDVPAPVYLMDRAEEDPSTLGISVVARFEKVEELDEDGEIVRVVGYLADKSAAKRGDFVADPAANPIGLHAGTGTMSEVIELAEREFGRLIDRLGGDDAAFARAHERGVSMLERLEDRIRERRAEAPEPAAPTPTEQPQALEAEENMKELSEALEALSAAQAELAAAKTALEQKDATIATYLAADEKRAQEAREAYVASLNERAQAAGAAPIDASKLAQVVELMPISEPGAKQLGEALLEAALATTTIQTVEDLGANPKQAEDAMAKAIAQGLPLSAVKE